MSLSFLLGRLGLLLLKEIALLYDAVLDTLHLGNGDKRVVTLAQNKDVGNTRGEFISPLVTQVDNIERTRVPFFVDHDGNPTTVGSLSDHAKIADIELNELGDTAGGKVELDGVVDLDLGVRVADSATIVRNNVRDGRSTPLLEGIPTNGLFASDTDFCYTAKLERCFFGGDTMQNKAPLGVVQQAEMLIRLLNADHVHEAGGIV